MGARADGDRCRGYARTRLSVSKCGAWRRLRVMRSRSWQPDVEFFQQALGFRIGNYGMTKWSDLFTRRQLVALSTFVDLVQEGHQCVRN